LVLVLVDKVLVLVTTVLVLVRTVLVLLTTVHAPCHSGDMKRDPMSVH